MEKDPDKRYQSAQEMLDAIEEFKRNPSIRFEYEYRASEDNPERNINRVVNSSKPGAKSASIRTGDARRVGTSNPSRSSSGKKKKKKAAKGFSLLPIFFGMAVAFVIGAAILIYLIFTNSSNLFVLQPRRCADYQLCGHDEGRVHCLRLQQPSACRVSGGVFQ